jgi:phosphate transport system permease protein
MTPSSAAVPNVATGPPPANRYARPKRGKSLTSLMAHGLPLVWSNGGALVLALVMIIGLLGLVFVQGMSTFWPSSMTQVKTASGKHHLGEIVRDERYQPDPSALNALPADARAAAKAKLDANRGFSERRLIRTDNFDLTGTHHNWVSDFEVVDESKPDWALLIERATNDGRFNGFPKEFVLDGQTVATDPAQVWALYNEHHAESRRRVRERERIKKNEVGAVSRKQRKAQVAVRLAELDHGVDSPQHAEAQQHYQEVSRWADAEQQKLNEQIAALNRENDRYKLKLATANGAEKVIPLGDIVRAFPPNQLGFFGKLGIYLSRWWEFLTDEPRNANSEGGVFPAIWGTAAMTLMMSFAVVPFGVLAALYMREYAKAGPIISAVRIAVNNLAGVPSVVYGVFGLGFFCYLIGGGIDATFFRAESGPTFGTGGLIWASFTLALLTLPVVIVATEEALAAVPSSMREGSYACGASKWQTIRGIVLPRAMPGILTGMILAMARGAGEVAPLMLVGAVKFAPRLPVDGVFPFVHPSRSFMHLGFHVYDVGFQSTDSESAKPMVFTTTLLLIALVAGLNLAAMWIRTRLRRKFIGSQF